GNRQSAIGNSTPSRQNVMHDRAMDVGESEVAALVTVGELLVVDAEAVEDGGVEIVHVDGVFEDVVAEVVGEAVVESRLDASARHPDGEASRMMVAAVVGF